MCAWGESNPHHLFRRQVLYPLSYRRIPGTIIPEMQTIDEQIEVIQEEIRKTPHHKGTNRFIGLMRAKIARLKDKEIGLSEVFSRE